jgi:hypothetical protein
MRTVPVNQSAGPLPEGCVPLRLISIINLFASFFLAQMNTDEKQRGETGRAGSERSHHIADTCAHDMIDSFG